MIAISDAVLAVIIGSGFTFLGVMVSSFIGLMNRKTNKRVEDQVTPSNNEALSDIVEANSRTTEVLVARQHEHGKKLDEITETVDGIEQHVEVVEKKLTEHLEGAMRRLLGRKGE